MKNHLQVLIYVLTVAATWYLSARLFIRARSQACKGVDKSLLFRSAPELDCNALLEVYRQKYLNFRHFDTLRWGVHTVVITAGGLVVTFAAGGMEAGREREITTVLFVLFGFFAGLSWWLLYRLTYNHMKNSFVLKEVADLIGDQSIPEVPKRWQSLLQSAAFLFMAFVGTLCSVAIVTAGFRLSE